MSKLKFDGRISRDENNGYHNFEDNTFSPTVAKVVGNINHTKDC